MKNVYLAEEQGPTPERQLDHAAVIEQWKLQRGFEDVSCEDIEGLDDAFLMGYIASLAIKRGHDPEAIYGHIGISVDQIDNTQ